ncbi:hypothetical protein GCM10022396_22740 [Flavivirga amylovorans]
MCGFCTDAQGQQPTLKVGDKAPEISIFKWIKGNEVKNFEKGKVYVLEFGATWCTGCIKMIPFLSYLAEKYKDEVEVLDFFVMEANNEPIGTKNPNYVQRVERFVTKKTDEISYRVAVDTEDERMRNDWLKAAGLSGLPQSFVIDKNGFIAWIGIGKKSLEEAVKFASSKDYQLKKAIENYKIEQNRIVKIDMDKPLFVHEGKGDNNDFMYRSVLKKAKSILPVENQEYYLYTRTWFDKKTQNDSSLSRPGLAQWVNMEPIDLYRIAYGDTLINQAMPFRHPFKKKQIWVDEWSPFFKSAYGMSWHTPIIEVKTNPELVGTDLWKNKNFKSVKNKYHYSVQVPEEKASGLFVQEVMQRDLKNYFGYDVSVEIREMPIWKLKATPNAMGLLKTKTPNQKYREEFPADGSWNYKNAIMRDMVRLLGNSLFGCRQYSQGRIKVQEEVPFIDETGFGDYHIDFEATEADRKSFNSYGKYLESKGLYLEKSTKPMKVIIIRDPKSRL